MAEDSFITPAPSGASPGPTGDGAAAVRDMLESAHGLAMPCVVASDGDRDWMLAMGVPVVATTRSGSQSSSTPGGAGSSLQAILMPCPQR